MSVRSSLKRWLQVPTEAPVVPADEPRRGAQAAAQAKRFRAAIDGIRKNANTSAKALGALGSAALSALAIGKFADVFPLETDSWLAWLAAVAAFLGFLTVAAALSWFTARLWRVDAPVAMSSDKKQVVADALPGDKPATKKAVKRFDDAARLNGAPSLQAYAARGRRLQRIAHDLPPGDPRRRDLFERADEIRNDVDAVLAHAAADIIRGRSRDVVAGPKTAIAAVAFVIGLSAVAISADYLESERSGRIAVARECATAGKALAEQTVAERAVPSICGGDSGQAVTEEERLISSAKACAAAVKALTDNGLSTGRLTGEEGPCPSAPASTTSRGAVVDGILASLLVQAQACERAQGGAAACDPVYALIRTERTRRDGAAAGP